MTKKQFRYYVRRRSGAWWVGVSRQAYNQLRNRMIGGMEIDEGLAVAKCRVEGPLHGLTVKNGQVSSLDTIDIFEAHKPVKRASLMFSQPTGTGARWLEVWAGRYKLFSFHVRKPTEHASLNLAVVRCLNWMNEREIVWDEYVPSLETNTVGVHYEYGYLWVVSRDVSEVPALFQYTPNLSYSRRWNVERVVAWILENGYNWDGNPPKEYLYGA